MAADCRELLIRDFGFRREEVTAETFRTEVAAFMRTLARHLGERHGGDARVGHALRQWIMQCDHYEAWDSLLTASTSTAAKRLVRRGRMLFPGPLTAHWDDAR